MSNIRKSMGFTLLEVLVALAIFATIMGLITVGLRTVLDTRERIGVHYKRLQELQLAMLILERDMEQMVQYSHKQSSLVSKAGTFQFIRAGVVNPLSRDKRSTLQKVEYTFSGNQLGRKTSSRLFSTGDEKNKDMRVATVMLIDVNNVSVQFLDKHKTLWDHWPLEGAESEDVTNFLPKAIMFTFDLKGWGKLNRIFYLPVGEYVRVK